MNEEKEHEKKEEIPKEPELEEVTPEPSGQQASEQQTPNQDFWTLLMKVAPTLLDKYLTMKNNEATARTKYLECATKHNRRMLYVLTIFLGVVIAFMSILTWINRVSGDALLFLVGTITGYVLLFIQRLVFPSQEQPSIEET